MFAFARRFAKIITRLFAIRFAIRFARRIARRFNQKICLCLCLCFYLYLCLYLCLCLYLWLRLYYKFSFLKLRLIIIVSNLFLIKDYYLCYYLFFDKQRATVFDNSSHSIVSYHQLLTKIHKNFLVVHVNLKRKLLFLSLQSDCSLAVFSDQGINV